MPKFYFHIQSENDFMEDTEGVELAGEMEAREEAMHAAREMVAERVRNGEIIDHHMFDVRDERGTKVFTLPFRDVLRLK